MSKLDRSASRMLAVAIGLALPMVAMAQPQDMAHSATVHSTAYELGRQEKTLTATVVSVDKDTRFVTLRGPKGKEVTVTAGPEVQNLDKLKPGDQVTAHYQAALALEVLPADSAKVGEETTSGIERHSPTGTKLGGVADQSVEVTSELTAIDLKNHTLTLKGPDGKERVMEVKDPERQARMNKLKVGQKVRVTYVEALAVDVTPKAHVKPKE